MATNDVPGSNPANKDQLAMGSWAEHEDGSHLFVQSTENDEVVYSMFDISKTPIQEFRDKMPIDEFKKFFSWNGSNVKWTWHDKTPFPWDKIIEAGATDGVRYASAFDQIKEARSVAKAIADKLNINPESLDIDELKHMLSKEGPRDIMQLIQSGIADCPPGKTSKKVQKLIAKREKLDKKIAAELA